MIAARNPTVRPGSIAKVSVPGCRRRDDPTSSLPRLAAAEGAITAHSNDIAGETWKPYEAPLAPAATAERRSNAVDMAAFQTPRWTFVGRRRTWFVLAVVEDPRASIPVPASIEAGIGGRRWSGSCCERFSKRRWPSSPGTSRVR